MRPPRRLRSVWKSSGRLADGREIIYFDEAPGSGRAQVRDTRDLGGDFDPASGPPSAAAGPESGLRWDPLVGEWVVIAAQRQGRTFLPPADQCPLDPSRPGRPTEIPAPDYDVVVFENRFPSLRGAGLPQREAGPGRGGRPGSAGRGTAQRPAPGHRAMRGGLLHRRS